MALALLAVAWLLTYFVHSTMLLGGAWVLSATGIVRSPAARDTLWKVCLVGGLLTATVYSAFPYQPYARHFLLPSAAQSAPAAPAREPPTGAPASPARLAPASLSGLPSAPIARPAGVAEISEAPASSAVRHYSSPITPHSSRLSWPYVLLGIWGLGALTLLGRLAICRIRLTRRLGRRREILDGPVSSMLDSLRAVAGVRRRIRLTASTELPGPVAMGPSEICLPERALTVLSPAEQRAVLAHELGHLVRQDPVWLALAVACENFFFFQPLNRLARRSIQEAAEYLCDDWAVHQTGGSLTLARCLAEVATWIEASPRAVPVSGMAENRSQLVERVHRLLEGAQPSVRRLKMAVPAAALALSSVAFAAPGISPPCDQDEASAVPRARLGSPASGTMIQGGVQTWATIRDGHLISFRDGFLPRLIGQGHLGIRRGGRQIELSAGQRILVDGQEVRDDGVVSVCESGTLRIVDENGGTLWRLEPVRLSPEQARAWAESGDASGEDLASARVDALREEMDSLNAAADLDAGDVEAVSRAAQELSERVTRQVSVTVAPKLAELQKLGVRISTEMAPRLAEMGARIATDIGPIIARAFGDSTCDSSAAPVRRGKTLSKPGR
jgi:beta-lactamase regulating signal transducer with metallopeptidase domain